MDEKRHGTERECKRGVALRDSSAKLLHSDVCWCQRTQTRSECRHLLRHHHLPRGHLGKQVAKYKEQKSVLVEAVRAWEATLRSGLCGEARTSPAAEGTVSLSGVHLYGIHPATTATADACCALLGSFPVACCLLLLLLSMLLLRQCLLVPPPLPPFSPHASRPQTKRLQGDLDAATAAASTAESRLAEKERSTADQMAALESAGAQSVAQLARDLCVCARLLVLPADALL